jgi:hypothetical protein
VPAEVEYGQPGEGTNWDPPSAAKPFGDVLSAGEQVDMAIKGKYINELGEIIDNGLVDNATNEAYDYVLVIPMTWDAESSDTMGHMRKDVLGNLEKVTIENSPAWARQEVDQNGLEYGDPAGTAPHLPFHDPEFFTVRVMDASGWCSDTDNATPVTVCRGADIADPTTVILSGTVLSYPDGPAREGITNAAVEVIMGAIKSGDLYDQPPEITAGPYSQKDLNQNTLSTDSAAPTAMPGNANVMWEYYDDQASCSGITHQWQYRVAGTTDPMTLINLPQVPMGPDATEGNWFQQWVWTTQVGTLDAGAYEMQAVVTDCAEQSVTSDSYYFSVGMDVDGDGIIDVDDNCPDNCNTQQLDADGDEIGDVCDTEDDGCDGCGAGPICEIEC